MPKWGGIPRRRCQHGNLNKGSGVVLISYARVSTVDQNLDLQRNALTEAGCEQIFIEQMSGAVADRPDLMAAIGYARSGDTLVVWKLDRLARSLTEALDTTTAHGRLMLTVLGGFAEFERELIHSRTSEGRERAKARGVKLGRQ